MRRHEKMSLRWRRLQLRKSKGSSAVLEPRLWAAHNRQKPRWCPKKHLEMKRGKWTTRMMKMIGQKCANKFNTKCLLLSQNLNNNSNHNSHLKIFSIRYLSNQSNNQLLKLMICSSEISNRPSQLNLLSLLSHLKRALISSTTTNTSSQLLKWAEMTWWAVLVIWISVTSVNSQSSPQQKLKLQFPALKKWKHFSRARRPSEINGMTPGSDYRKALKHG